MAAIKSNILIKIGPFFGVPVSVLSATEDEAKAQSLSTLCEGIAGNKLHPAHSPNKIKQALKCPTCENDDRTTFIKGREKADGTFAIIGDAELEAVGEAVPADVKDSITLTSHPAEQVLEHTLTSGKVYYLGPGKGGEDAYPLLVEMLRERPNLAFCTVWAPRSSPSMYRLGVYGDVLTLNQLAWPASVKQAPSVKTAADPKMVAMALTLADQLTADFDPESFKNTRAETLAAFVAAAEGVPGAVVPTTATAAKPKGNAMLDMLAAAVAASAPAAAAKPAPKKRAPRKTAAA